MRLVAETTRPDRITDYGGCLLLCRPRETRDITHRDGATVTAVVTDLLVLDGEDGPPRTVRGVVVTQVLLARRLRTHLRDGTISVGRPAQVPSRTDPDRKVWVFDPPTATDLDLARLYVQENGDPFRATA